MSNKRLFFIPFLIALAACTMLAQARRRVTIEDVITLAPKDAPPATASISGTVVSQATALPVSGATVTLARRFDSPLLAILAQGERGRTIAPIRTDSNGRFVFADLPEGEYGVTVQMDGYLSRKIGESGEEGRLSQLTIATGQRIEGFQIAIAPSARVRGIARDETGQPRANVPVQLFVPSDATASIAQTLSAADGSFDLVGFEPGRFILFARSPLDEEQPRSFAAVVLATVAGVSQDIVLTNRADLSIRGTIVMKGTNNPPASASVAIVTAPLPGARLAASVQTDFQYDPTSGAFTMSALRPGFYKLTPSSPGSPFGGCLEVNVVLPNRDASDVQLTVSECI